MVLSIGIRQLLEMLFKAGEGEAEPRDPGSGRWDLEGD